MYSKNYEFVILSVTKVCRFQRENAPKAFAGRDPPRPAEGAYSALPDLLAAFKGCGQEQQGKGKGKRDTTKRI